MLLVSIVLLYMRFYYQNVLQDKFYFALHCVALNNLQNLSILLGIFRFFGSTFTTAFGLFKGLLFTFQCALCYVSLVEDIIYSTTRNTRCQHFF